VLRPQDMARGCRQSSPSCQREKPCVRTGTALYSVASVICFQTHLRLLPIVPKQIGVLFDLPVSNDRHCTRRQRLVGNQRRRNNHRHEVSRSDSNHRSYITASQSADTPTTVCAVDPLTRTKMAPFRLEKSCQWANRAANLSRNPSSSLLAAASTTSSSSKSMPAFNSYSKGGSLSFCTQ